MGRSVELLRNLAGLRNLGERLLADPASKEPSGQCAYRCQNGGDDSGNVKDPWQRRIIELSDVRSVGEINEILYREEIMAGASAVDIGLWKQLFCRCVTDEIAELERRGYIRLQPRRLQPRRLQPRRLKPSESTEEGVDG